MTSDDRGAPPLAALASLLGAILVLSFTSILIRLSLEEIGPFATTFYRYLIATAVLFVVHVLLPPEAPPSEGASRDRRTIGLLFLAVGASSAIDIALLSLALSMTSVANATVLGNTAPILTALAAYVLYRKRLSARYFVSFGLMLTGLVIILHDHHTVHQSIGLGNIIALSSTVFFTAYVLAIEALRRSMPARTVLLGASAIATVISAVLALLFEHRLVPITITGWLVVIALALGSQVIGQGLVSYSLRAIESQRVTLVFLLQPVLAAVWAFLLFSEVLTLYNVSGIALVLAGLYLEITRRQASLAAS